MSILQRQLEAHLDRYGKDEAAAKLDLAGGAVGLKASATDMKADTGYPSAVGTRRPIPDFNFKVHEAWEPSLRPVRDHSCELRLGLFE